MIPTMLVVGLGLGLLPRWWPHSLVVTAALAVLVSLGFGFLIGHPLVGGALALANTAIGVGLGRVVQPAVLRPRVRRRPAA
jgi:hypothetical protein